MLRHATKRRARPRRRRPSRVAAAAFVAVLLVIWGVDRLIVQPAFLELEREQALEDGTRARAAIEAELRQLGNHLADWAQWDDAYAFAADPAPAFIQSNLSYLATLERNTAVDLIVILNRDGRRLFAGAYDANLGGRALPAVLAGDPPLVWERLAPDDPDDPADPAAARPADGLRGILASGEPLLGLLPTEFGLLMLGADVIVTTDDRGPPRGVLALARFLDPMLVRALAVQTQVEFDLLPAGDPRLTPLEREYLRAPTPAGAALRPNAAGVLTVYEVLTDLAGRPVALLRTPIRQGISSTAQRTSRALIGALGIATLALLLAFGWWSNRVLEPADGGDGRGSDPAWGASTLALLIGLTLSVGIGFEARRSGLIDSGHWWVEAIGGVLTLLVALYLFALVSRRRLAERLVADRTRELQASEARMRSIIDHAPFGLLFYRRDAADRLLFNGANPAAEALLGSSLGECVGKPLEQVFPELAQTPLPAAFRRVAEQGGTARWPAVRCNDADDAGTFEVAAFQTAPDDLAVAFADITERERAADELHHRDRLLEATAAAMGLLLSGRDLDAAVGAALARLGAAAAADRVYVFENHRDPVTDAPLFSQRYEWCAAGTPPQIDNPLLRDQPYANFAWRWYQTLGAGQAISGLVRDFPDGERAMLEPQGIRSLLALPIMLEERFWGFIGFNACHDDRHWTPIEETVLRSAAAALGHAYVRRRAEAALRASEARLRDVANNIPGVVYQFYARPDGSQGFHYLSERALDLFGVAFAARDGLGALEDYLPPEDVIGFRASLAAAVAAAAPWDFEGRFLRPRGGSFWFKALAHPARLGDELVFTGVIIDISERKQAERMIEHLAYYDALTELPNRALLAERAEFALALAARRGSELAVLFLDLDRFKDVNDSLGHDAGDALLVQVAERLRALARPGDTVCRLGGDEFVLLLPEAGQEAALKMADRVLASFRQPFDLPDCRLGTTTSVGIALYPHDGADVAELLKNADTALYRAKQDGRNTRVFYDRAMNQATLERLLIEAELRRALASGQLRAYYEPKVRLADGALVGAEALMRWQHPAHGLLGPGRFIPVAEASDLIVELGDWMLGEVCRQLAAWRRAGLAPPPVSVNLAARHFAQPALADRIRGLLAAWGLPPQALALELTESALLQGGAETNRTLEQLEALGVGLALDDFGTGYSSLAYLKRLPLTTLKIDRSFVRDLVTDPDDRTIAATILALGHQMELTVVAEGVETEAQRQILLAQGCDEAQGYLFARPAAAAEFASAWLTNRTPAPADRAVEEPV